MNAKQIALWSALAATLAGAAQAQTVPAELWVGPHLSVYAGERTRAQVTADLRQHMAQPQAPQEFWGGSAADAQVAAGAASRAEVLADLRMFQRAGLADYQSRENYDPASAQARQRIATYQRLRSGPEFAQEVARIEGRAERTVARAKLP